MWKSFLGVVGFILTKYEPVSSHGNPVRAKYCVFLSIRLSAENKQILLSFAPSAAAVWHCDRERITCERNSARHSVFPFKRLAGQYVFAPVFSPRKYKNNKNKTKQNSDNCSPFLTGNVGVLCLQVCPQTGLKNRTEGSPFFGTASNFPTKNV